MGPSVPVDVPPAPAGGPLNRPARLDFRGLPPEEVGVELGHPVDVPDVEADEPEVHAAGAVAPEPEGFSRGGARVTDGRPGVSCPWPDTDLAAPMVDSSTVDGLERAFVYAAAVAVTFVAAAPLNYALHYLQERGILLPDEGWINLLVGPPIVAVMALVAVGAGYAYLVVYFEWFCIGGDPGSLVTRREPEYDRIRPRGVVVWLLYGFGVPTFVAAALVLGPEIGRLNSFVVVDGHVSRGLRVNELAVPAAAATVLATVATRAVCVLFDVDPVTE